jgi:hypothetical protein
MKIKIKIFRSVFLTLILVLTFNFHSSGQNFDFELKKVYPKLVTPDILGLSGQNENVFFSFSNLTNEEFRLRIFDLEGRNITEIPTSNLNWKYRSGSNDYFVFWNCRDSGSQIVQPGVYLYFVETKKKTFTGAITVAR